MKERKHPHYYKSCPYDEIDVYRLLEIFDITDQTIGHAIKKLLVAGGRGYKDIGKDIQDVIDTLERWKEMRQEDLNFKKKDRSIDYKKDVLNPGVETTKVSDGWDNGWSTNTSSTSKIYLNPVKYGNTAKIDYSTEAYTNYEV